jgi:iron complex transport system ATP-binding protein
MIDAREIGRKMPDGAWLWRRLTLKAERRRVVGVIGRNGSGKTTLLRTLLGLVEPHEGSISITGTTGYVPQRSEISFPYTVRDIVTMGRARHVRLFARLTRGDHDAVARAMQRVGVAHLADRPFLELSGGERQLVLIARAVATQCDVLVLDEPFAGLDLENQRQVLSLIRILAHDEGIGVLFSAHQPDHLFAVAENALALQRGADAIQGKLPETLTSDVLTAVYGVEVRVIELAHACRINRHAVAALSA